MLQANLGSINNVFTSQNYFSSVSVSVCPHHIAVITITIPDTGRQKNKTQWKSIEEFQTLKIGQHGNSLVSVWTLDNYTRHMNHGPVRQWCGHSVIMLLSQEAGQHYHTRGCGSANHITSIITYNYIIPPQSEYLNFV